MAGPEPGGAMRGRVEVDRVAFWILMGAGRWTLAAGLALAVFLSLLAFAAIGPAPMRRVIDSSDALWWVFSPMITAIVTAVTVVVSFNQLVLSQELGAVGDQRERMRGAMAFREDVEPHLDREVAPPAPAAFLAAILEAVRTRADDVDAALSGDATKADAEIRRFLDELREDATGVRDRLRDAQFGTFEVTFTALDFDYSSRIHGTRRLLARHGRDLDDEAIDGLEGILTVLEFFGPAREHIKTLYFQWELVNLSRAVLVASIPALATAIGLLLYVDTTGVTGSVAGVDAIVVLVCAGVTITLAPFFVLMAFVLRIVTVTKRTLAIGPFVLRDDESTDTVSAIDE